MPSIDEKIRARVRLVDTQLNLLPELPNDNVQHVVRQRLQEFSNGVQGILEGSRSSSSNNFLSQWSELSTDFAEAIQSIKPKFIITDASDDILSRPEIINLDDDDSDSGSLMSSPSTLRRVCSFCLLSIWWKSPSYGANM